MSINLTMSGHKPSKNTQTPYNNNLKTLCFEDFINNDLFGFGRKRISVLIKNTITEKFVFRAFGYRNKDLKLFIGLRMYYDQGDSFKIIAFDETKTIVEHIISLVHEYEIEDKIKKNSLNTVSSY